MKLYKIDCWNSWTSKSEDTPFEKTIQTVGHGEQKLGKELNTEPLGQNFKYDLKVLNEKWEIKKLDKDNSFRLGVEVSSRYSSLLFSIINIFNQLELIQKLLVSDSVKKKITELSGSINNLSGQSKIKLLEGLKKDEVSESNLEKANNIIESLKSYVIYDKSQLDLYSSYDGKKHKYPMLDAFHKLSLEPIAEEKKVSLFGGPEIFDRLLITSKIGDELDKFRNTTLKHELDKLVRSVFIGIRLVFVHKQKGFKPIKNIQKIYCYRITHGGPRCRFINTT